MKPFYRIEFIKAMYIDWLKPTGALDTKRPP